MVLNQKVKRTIFERKAMYLGSIVLIIISAMLFSSFNLAGINLEQNLSLFRSENVLEDDYFILQNKIDELELLEEKYDVLLEERLFYDYQYAEDTTLKILSATEKINKYAIVEGKGIENDDEIMIDPSFAKVHNLTLNSVVEVEGKHYRIVGYMTLPDYTYPLKSENELLRNPNTFGVAVMSKTGLKDLEKGITFYSIKFNQDNREEFKKYLTETNYIIHWVNQKDNNRITFIDSDIESIIKIGKYLPVAILLLTIVLVSIILWRLLKAEYVEIGTLYALGYRKKEILLHYLSYPVVISLTGGIIGIIIGGLFVAPLLELYALFYNLPVFEIEYDFKYLLISFILPLLFLLPTTVLILYKVLKLSPLILMRGGANKTKVNFIERKLNLNRFRFKTKFKIRELVRNLPRTLLLLIGVTFASMLYLMGFVVMDSMNYLINNSYDDVYKYNYEYIYSSFQTVKQEEGEVVNFSPYTLENTDKTVVVYGVPTDTELIQLRDLDGNLLDFNNVIISKSLADKLDVEAGDSLVLENKLNSKVLSLKIDNIADYYLGDNIFMPLNEFNRLNGYPEGSYLEVLAENELDIDESMLFARNNKDDLINSFETLLKPIKYAIGLIAVFAFIIGLIVIYVVTSLLIEENKVNISLFKVMGYERREIYGLIFGSNTLIVIAGYLLSIPLLLSTLNNFFMMITEEMSVAIPVKINQFNLIIGFVLIYLTYFISNLLNKGKINKISMADILKSRAE